MPLTTQKAFAKTMDMSQQYINRLVKRGIIKKYSGGKIDPVQAERAIKEKSNPGTTSDKMLTDKESEQHYKAKMAKLKYEQESGKLFDGEVFFPLLNKTLTSIMFEIRQRILQIPTKYMSKLLNLKTLPEAKAVLEEIARDILLTIKKEVNLKKIIDKVCGNKKN